MNSLEQLRSLTRHLQIAHHIPGRIRLKLNPAGLALSPQALQGEARRLQSFVESLPGIRTLRPNLLALSCVVEYDQQVLSHRLWEALVRGEAEPEVLALLDEIADRYYSFDRHPVE